MKFKFIKRKLLSNKFSIIPGNAQSIGKRGEQQDSFGFTDIFNKELVDKVGGLVVLADGMGGLERGGEASLLAVKTMINNYTNRSSKELIYESLYMALNEANFQVLNFAEKEGLNFNVGSTLVAAVIFKKKLYWISVGDSRIYLFRKGRLIKINTEHIFAKQLEKKVVNGEITVEEADDNPEKNFLTSFLGLEQLDEIDQNTSAIELENKDMIMLCSDGLYNALSHKEISSILNKHNRNPQKAAEELIKKVKEKNLIHQDNATVAILEYFN